MSAPVCVVVGVGPGNGAAFARRFAADGYAVALLARSTEFTGALAGELGSARAYACDVRSGRAVSEAFEAIRGDLGEVSVLVYNAGSGVGGTIATLKPEEFERPWQINTMGLFRCAQEVVPAMRAAEHGAIVIVGATASWRGKPYTTAFASAKAAQRSLAQSLARDLWPAGIHVALLIIDGVVDLEATRVKMPDKADTFFVQPADVAANAAWLVRQPRSVWSFEVECRPFGENW